MTNETGINGQLISLLLQLHLDTQIICIIVVLKVLNSPKFFLMDIQLDYFLTYTVCHVFYPSSRDPVPGSICVAGSKFRA